MAWERGAWEKRTSNPLGSINNEKKDSPDKVIFYRSKNSDKNKDKLKQNLNKFTSKGWKVSKKKIKSYTDGKYYNAPYQLKNNGAISDKIFRLLSSKSSNTKNLVVCNDEHILNKISLNLSNNHHSVFKSSNSLNHLDNLINNIKNFQKINYNLSSNYSLRIFKDIHSADDLDKLEILSENVCYIGQNDAKLLNEFIKLYWDYYELSNYSSIDLNLAKRNLIPEISRHVNDLNILNNYVKRLNKIFSILDVKIDDIDDFDIEILKNNPSLINNDKTAEFLELMNTYQNINVSKRSATDYFNKFLSNNYILGIVANYQRFIDGKDNFEKINHEILDIKNQISLLGFNVTNIKDYMAVKDELKNYSEVFFIDDKDFESLSSLLSEFLKYNLSFGDFLNRCKKNVIFNMDSNSIYVEINDAVSNILACCSNLGIEISTFSDLTDYENDFSILKDYTNLSDNDSGSEDISLSEYTKNLFDDLKGICEEITQKAKPLFDIVDLDLIKYNYNALLKSIDNIGLKINNFKELNDSFLKIVNVEIDSSDKIFSPRTSIFLQNDRQVIHSELDNLKNSLNFITDKFKNHPEMLNATFNDFTDMLSKQQRIDFFIANIGDYIESSNSIDTIIENHDIIIKSAVNLATASNMNEYKSKLEQLKNEFSLIESAYNEGKSVIGDEQSYLKENISSFENSIREKFSQLLNSGRFDLNKLKSCDITKNIDELTKNMDISRDYIKINNWSDVNFKEIMAKNNHLIKHNDEIKSIIENSDIYNFYDTCGNLNMPDYDFKIVNDILVMSSELKIKQYNDFSKFTLEDIKKFITYLENSRKFSRHLDSGLINPNFRYLPNEFNQLNLKIESVQNQLADLKLDQSVLENLSQISLEWFGEIKHILEKVKSELENDSSDVDVIIQKGSNILDDLIYLCSNHYIEFEINGTKFNSSDFKLNLDSIREEFDENIKLYQEEHEISQFRDYIENNLSDIWKGPLTDIDVIKNKFEIDREFTKLYNRGIFSENSLKNMNQLSESDLIFLNELKNNPDVEFKSKCKQFFKNREYLTPQIEKLNKLSDNDLKSILSVFVNVNKIFKSREISYCITLLEYNAKHDDSIRMIKDYENELKSYSVIYYKYFNRREFDISINEMKKILDLHFKFTDLVNHNLIGEDYTKFIKSNFTNFTSQIEELKRLKDKINSDAQHYFGTADMTFDEMIMEYDKMDGAEIMLLNIGSVKTGLNSDYSNYFDNVYVVEDNQISDEDKLHLFLISKNKISILKLRGE